MSIAFFSAILLAQLIAVQGQVLPRCGSMPSNLTVITDAPTGFRYGERAGCVCDNNGPLAPPVCVHNGVKDFAFDGSNTGIVGVHDTLNSAANYNNLCRYNVRDKVMTVRDSQTLCIKALGFCDPLKNNSACCAVDGCSACPLYVTCSSCAAGWQMVGGGQCVAQQQSTATPTPSAPLQRLLGHWTFEVGEEMVDLAGNFPPLSLHGDATIANGTLDLNGLGQVASGWAVTGRASGGYAGPAIGDKTLVVWLQLDSFRATAGAAIAIDRDNVGSDTTFDGIVFAEREAQRWMAGSDGHVRTVDFVPGFQELQAPTAVIQLAVAYKSVGAGMVRIEAYRNGALIGNYTTGSFAVWSTGDAQILFGHRHHLVSHVDGVGAIDAHIYEVQLYGVALLQAEIAALSLKRPHDSTATLRDGVSNTPVSTGRPPPTTAATSSSGAITVGERPPENDDAGVIVGAAIGALVALGLLTAGGVVCWKRSKRSRGTGSGAMMSTSAPSTQPRYASGAAEFRVDAPASEYASFTSHEAGALASERTHYAKTAADFRIGGEDRNYSSLKPDEE